jgi:hypothetical protein
MKGFLFLTLFIVLAYIAYSFTVKEGFENRLDSEQGLIKMPANVPPAQPLEASSPAPYMPPADKEYGPAFGEVSRVNTLPYRDPALETASLKRLKELRQEVAGFLSFEAKGLQDQGDPAIQLPLGTLRSDSQRLNEEVDVLNRNPGLNSQLTLRDVNDIQANLNYLRKKYRLSINSTTEDASFEGFEDVSGARATQKELESASMRVKAEIVKLSYSATTDPVTKSRVAVLTRIRDKIDEIIKEVKSGVRTADQIPVMKSDLDSFLTTAGDVNSPVSKFLDENGLPATLANLFPAYESGDISGAKLASYLFDQYADTIVKGLSWNIGVKYTAPYEAMAGGGKNGQSGFTTGTNSTIDNLWSTVTGNSTSAAGTTENVVGPANDVSSPYTYGRGEMEDCTNPSRNQNQSPSSASHYDWKTKAGQICEAVRKQGLNPGDYGCLESSASVSPDYSWRGNARMVCTRLQASYNTALPELCGCPPMNWPGWRA